MSIFTDSIGWDDALACECFITGEYCFCESGCECGCPDCDCDGYDVGDFLSNGCACGGNCLCNQSEELEGGDSNESNENY